MNYQETLDWMFVQLPMYQRKGGAAYKKDLSNTLLFSEALGAPEKKFKSIHVAGTNGKGSTSHMLASVLQEAGYKVGLYTSPHLIDFRERIKINGKEISKAAVVTFVAAQKTFLESQQLSFFELTVGMAFDHFSREKVDFAVVEVGLGGRLDSTNILLPEVSVITNIGLDHTQFLGTTLEKIAFEKGGIIKKGVPVVIGEYQPETLPVFERLSKERNAPLFLSSTLVEQTPISDLKGNYQYHNLKTVVQTVVVLNELGHMIADQALQRGLQRVVSNTGLLGRWQLLNTAPRTICDTAHNKEGLSCTLAQLRETNYDNLHLVLGVVSDKDLESIFPLFPTNATYYFCKPNLERGLDSKLLQEKALAYGLEGDRFDSVSQAYKSAQEAATKKDCIYIGGSTFVVAEILQ
jgi:dihydrofolate synthase / folylpolyglutamate synthase